MAGGLLQLIAKGAQDHNLVGNPQISFFKVVYRRYTNFSMETIKLDIEGSNISSSGKTLLNIPIKKNAEIVSNMYYTFELPHIYNEEFQKKDKNKIIDLKKISSNKLKIEMKVLDTIYQSYK